MRTLSSSIVHRYALGIVCGSGALALSAFLLGEHGVVLATSLAALTFLAMHLHSQRRRALPEVGGDDLLGAIDEPAALVSADATVVGVNDRWASLFGETRSALVGSSLVAPFVPRVAHAPLAMAVRRALAAGHSEETVSLGGVGTWTLIAHRVAHDGGRAVIIRAQDVDAHQRLRDLAEQRAASLARLGDLIGSLGQTSIEHLREQVARAAAGADGTALVLARTDATRMVILAASHTRLRRGQGMALDPTGPIAGALLEGSDVELARTDLDGGIDILDRALRGWSEALAVPVWRDGELAGALLVCHPRALDADARDWVRTCARLLSIAESGADHRALQARTAGCDPLTGHLNHRAFVEALGASMGRARAQDDPLSVAIFNIDHFRALNDLHGHEAGDAVLAEVARRLDEELATGEVLGRIGGEEFAVMMPGCQAQAAEGAAEWLRTVIVTDAFDGVGHVTVSVGVADSTHLDEDGDAGALLRLAGGAVFWAKAHGRNQTVLYDPKVVRELSATERAERIERAHAMATLRALARVVDARDQMTHRHAERVAHMAYRLALADGWTPQAAGRLRDAALVHDVGKVAVPDAILHKPGPLDDEEMDRVREHAHIGALIVSEVMADDQVAWVRGHHERWDGRGYPDRRRDEDIPAGAALIALADAWDVMTAVRPYRTNPLTAEEALAECRIGSGGQFAPRAVRALERLWDEGWIGPGQPTPRAPRRVGPVDLSA